MYWIFQRFNSPLEKGDTGGCDYLVFDHLKILFLDLFRISNLVLRAFKEGLSFTCVNDPITVSFTKKIILYNNDIL